MLYRHFGVYYVLLKVYCSFLAIVLLWLWLRRGEKMVMALLCCGSDSEMIEKVGMARLPSWMLAFGLVHALFHQFCIGGYMRML